LGLEEKEGIRSNAKEVIPWPRLLRRNTPDYIIYKESGTDKIRITAGYRAVKFEEKH